MSRVLSQFVEHSQSNYFPFTQIDSVTSYDDTTLFCPAGMQRFKDEFKIPPLKDKDKTVTTCQACLRLNDLDFLGDGSHYAYFRMLGLFSFQKMTVAEAIQFWLGYLKRIDLVPDRFTVHPELFDKWVEYYPKDLRHLVEKDSECVWSDGHEASGYCTEFYLKGIEIGNIVNTGGHSIDCGFGLERIEQLYYKHTSWTEEELLQKACERLIKDNVIPSNKGQGYVLRKLLRRLVIIDGKLSHKFFIQELERQAAIRANYVKLKDRYSHMPASWWLDTHGIVLELM